MCVCMGGWVWVCSRARAIRVYILYFILSVHSCQTMWFLRRKCPALVSLTVLLFLVQTWHVSKATASARLYERRPQTSLSASVVTGSLNARSKLECAEGCSQATECKNFSWNEGSKQCLLSDVNTWRASTEDDVSTDDQTWNTYSDSGKVYFQVSARPFNSKQPI